jgi:hypothetical protein
MRGLGNLRLAETLQGYAAFLGRTTRRAAADRVRDDTSGCNAGAVSKVHGTSQSRMLPDRPVDDRPFRPCSHG